MSQNISIMSYNVVCYIISHRSVSLTSVVSKILKNIVAAKIKDLEGHRDILQKSNMDHRSCEVHLLLTPDDIARNINRNHQMNMGILQFEKAYLKRFRN